MEEIIEVLKSLDFSNIAWQIATPLIFSIADFLTGFIQAVINHDVDSQKMRTGLWHKTLLLIIIILGFTIDFAFNLNFVSKSICIFIISMEVVSIAENLKKAGIEIGRIGNILKTESGETINNVNYKKTVEIISKISEENKKEREDSENE